jgi:hypothetical protein
VSRIVFHGLGRGLIAMCNVIEDGSPGIDAAGAPELFYSFFAISAGRLPFALQPAGRAHTLI